MSGGYFNYAQFRIGDIEAMIEEEIEKIENGDPDEYGYSYGDYLGEYKDDVVKRMKEAVVALARARVYAHRIDWFLSGDNGPERFLKRLDDDLRAIEEKQE